MQERRGGAGDAAIAAAADKMNNHCKQEHAAAAAFIRDMIDIDIVRYINGKQGKHFPPSGTCLDLSIPLSVYGIIIPFAMYRC